MGSRKSEERSVGSNKSILERDNNVHTSVSNHVHLSVIREIIPESLLHVYAPKNLQFEVTRSMLRQSRPIIGNVQRLHAYLKKLRSQQCTTVLFLGGSVTGGHNAGGPKNAYPNFFMEWLNERYPCKAENGALGKHESKRTHAQNSQTHFINFSTISAIEKFDLVFLEFNVNDGFIPDNPHALEDRGSVGQMRGE